MNCIETKDLSFCFTKNEMIINNINIQVPQGSIYGFIGPNGAGKTTTLKLILGLLKQQSGFIHLFGKNFDNNRIEILKQVGSLIESPSLYSHLTAEENLRILQLIYQCPKSRINEVIEIVGLTNAQKKRTAQYSLGMKQRLSIAIALLHNPQLLILDEPTNGLDPNGILEVRELLLKLNKEHNITILISSHLLSEIEKIVSHVGIINKGSIIFQGSFNELQHKQLSSSFVRFETNDVNKSLEVLTKNQIKYHVYNEFIEIPNTSKDIVAKINKELVIQDIEVFQISNVKNDLESIFIDILKK